MVRWLHLGFGTVGEDTVSPLKFDYRPRHIQPTKLVVCHSYMNLQIRGSIAGRNRYLVYDGDDNAASIY